MKIGILIRRFNNLENWELRIIEEIIDNPKLELTVLIQDGRKGKDKVNLFGKRLLRFLRSKNVLGKLLIRIQSSIEGLFYKDHLTVDKRRIINQLKKIRAIELCPKRKDSLDVFSDEDGKKIKKFDLDIIFKHAFNLINGTLLYASKYGVWSFQHGDNSLNHYGPVGFWEIILKQSSVGVTLQQLTPEHDSILIIDKAFFNHHWSMVKTNRMIMEASVSLLFKNIRKLENCNYSPSSSLVCFTPLYRIPSFKNSLKYVLLFYAKLFSKPFRYINTTLFGARYRCWTLFIGKGDFMNAILYALRPIEMPKDEFWADPFFINYNEARYLFFENYSYKTKRGKISCGVIENGELCHIRDVLDLDYHLSFPFVFEEIGELFLMPETKENNRLELYRCVGFPDKWELYATAFEGEKVVDAFFYNDENAQKWLFVNKQAYLNAPVDNELYIYKVESLKLDGLEPHRLNPVIISSRNARNGGAIFKYKNEIFRPSQANIDGVYGRALNINRIEKLTIDEYIETDVITVYPNFHKGLMAMHHLNQSNGLFAIDAAYIKK